VAAHGYICNTRQIRNNEWRGGGIGIHSRLKICRPQGLRVRVPPALPNSMRIYLNFEKGHIQALLRALEELEVFRGFLTERQTFVETLLIEALDKIDKGM
tara:strand:+ start:1981 stop:2280 length:300 start_codon:yes stop_codon:yes gene_type:complete